MNKVDAAAVKERARVLGADLCGIAAAECFTEAPAGFHPADVLPGCRSVIVAAVRFPASTLRGPSQAAYTFVRNRLVEKMDSITFALASELEDRGYQAIVIPSSDPYDSWDAERRHGRGILSLKHAAVLAGLGRMGKNTLLVNDQYGNMIWLGAVLVDKVLDADPPADYEPCISSCRICLDSCPAGALDGTTIVQKKCREIAGKYTDGGGFVYACNVCRKVCPRVKGMGS